MPGMSTQAMPAIPRAISNSPNVDSVAEFG
jgi:hypothetical protein